MDSERIMPNFKSKSEPSTYKDNNHHKSYSIANFDSNWLNGGKSVDSTPNKHVNVAQNLSVMLNEIR